MDNLFDDDDGGDIPEEKITINKKYAAKFQKFKECQELDRLKQKYGENVEDIESSSTSESEDEDAEALTPQLEKDFLKTLSLIKSKDPTIYAKETVFYKSNNNVDETNSIEDEKKSKKEKPILLKDYERKRLLEKGNQAYVSDSEDERDETSENQFNNFMYNDEQVEIKKSLKQALNDDEDSGDDDLLQIREKSQEEKVKEHADYDEWLQKEKKKQQSVGSFSQFWSSNEELDENEKFLRNYILNKQYKDDDDGRLPTYKEIVDDSDDDDDGEELDREEEFERKFNFRYEDPDQEFIKRYPRTIVESVRRKDDRRVSKRKERDDRKKKEKDKKKEEIKKLKNLKRKEIMNKLEKLKDITGNNKIGILEDDLNGDFDAAKYDQLMQQVFDNEYYDGGSDDDDEKPVFSDDAFSDEEKWDEWTGGEVNNQGEDTKESKDVETNLHCEDPGFNMDADFDSTRDETEMIGKKGKRLSKFAKAIKRKKPVFNPAEKTFEEYLNEYYQLDYEDIIDDMPVRFKYRPVVSNNFGLSTEEILHADDKELNQWCSLRKTMKYITDEEEMKERMKFKKKARNREKKKQAFQFLQNETDASNNVSAENPSKRQSAASTTSSPWQSSSDRGFRKQKATNYLKPRDNHAIIKKKHFNQSNHKLNNNIRNRNKHFNNKRKTTMNELSTTKTKNIRKQFKGGNKDIVGKLSANRLAAYGLDKRKKKDQSS